VQTESNRVKMPTIQKLCITERKVFWLNIASALLYGYFCLQNHKEVSSTLMMSVSFMTYYFLREMPE
jgi:uncharacterized membrane protein